MTEKEKSLRGTRDEPELPAKKLVCGVKTIADDNPDVMAAKAPDTSAKRLSELSCSSNIYVLSELAQNPRTPGAILDRLSRNSDPVVFCAVAGNPSTPRETLWDMHARVTCSLKFDKYEFLVDHKTILEYCRNKIAGNPSTPPNLLRVLAQEGGDQVFCAIEDANSALSGEPKRLHRMVAAKFFPGSRSTYCLKTVAKNPSAPEDVLLELLRLGDPKVSSLAGKNLERPDRMPPAASSGSDNAADMENFRQTTAYRSAPAG